MIEYNIGIFDINGLSQNNSDRVLIGMTLFNSRVLKMECQVTGIELNHDQAELAREKYHRLISGGFYYKS